MKNIVVAIIVVLALVGIVIDNLPTAKLADNQINKILAK